MRPSDAGNYLTKALSFTDIGATRGGGVPIVGRSGAGCWLGPTRPGCNDHRPQTRSARSRHYSAPPR